MQNSNYKSRRSKKSNPLFSRLSYPLFFPISIIYMELILRIGTTDKFFSYGLILTFLFSISAGFLFYFICSLSSNPKVNRIISLILIGLVTVFYNVEFFCKNAYQNFFDLKALFVGTAGVVGQFGNVVFSTILSGIWIILLFCIPFIVLLLGTRKHIHTSVPKTVKWPLAIIALLLTAAFYLISLAFTYMSPGTGAKYNKEYDYDTATKTFGLMTSTRLDIKNLIFGTDNSFAAEEIPEDTPTAEPSADASAAPSAAPSVAPSPAVYGDNVMDIDFAALAEAEDSSTIADIHTYVGAVAPTKENEYTGLFEGKNLILITAEAFSAEIIDKDLTPTLYRLANQGIQVKEYYQPAWGGSTSTGEYSMLTGLVPTQGVSSMTATADNNLYLSLGNQLNRLGYTSQAYHNGYYDYYSRDITHKNFGYDTWIGIGNGLDEMGVTEQWPESDLEMMQATVDEYINEDRFSVYYMTISGHCLYSVGGNNMSKKNYDTINALPAFANASETIKCYYAANLELEYALEYLVERLEQAGKADDTVICLTTDHYPYGLEKSDSWGNDEDYLSELYGYEVTDMFERDHSALIIWSGCLEDMEPIVVEEPTYSLDIVPTLSNLFGLDYDSRLLVGRDILSDAAPLVIFGDYSWVTDRGRYNAQTGEFTPDADETDVSDDYISSVKTKVRNKISFSDSVLSYDYYGIIFNE